MQLSVFSSLGSREVHILSSVTMTLSYSEQNIPVKALSVARRHVEEQPPIDASVVVVNPSRKHNS